jgi:hypothetical protein
MALPAAGVKTRDHACHGPFDDEALTLGSRINIACESDLPRVEMRGSRVNSRGFQRFTASVLDMISKTSFDRAETARMRSISAAAFALRGAL